MTDKMSMVLMKSRFKKITGVLAHFSLDHSTVEPKAVCVLGLLYFYTGKMKNQDILEGLDLSGDFKLLHENYGITQEQFDKMYDCPLCEMKKFGLNDFLIHLNDYHDSKNQSKDVVSLTLRNR
jgi:hypothetical protein